MDDQATPITDDATDIMPPPAPDTPAPGGALTAAASRTAAITAQSRAPIDIVPSKPTTPPAAGTMFYHLSCPHHHGVTKYATYADAVTAAVEHLYTKHASAMESTRNATEVEITPVYHFSVTDANTHPAPVVRRSDNRNQSN